MLPLTITFALSIMAEPNDSLINTTVVPPIAPKIAKTDVLHGETRVDNYYWLRDKTNPQVLDYLNKPSRKMCSLYLALLDKVGVHLPQFGDSSERLAEV